MESVIDFIGELKAPRQEFSAQHPYPFLVMRMSAAELEKQAFAFETIGLSEAVQRRAEKLTQLRKEGKRLARSAHELVIFRVRKRADGPFRNCISVGRTGHCDISIADGQISKMHAYFERDEASGDHFVIDAGSRNGTKVNGRLLSQNQRHALHYGDRVEFGNFCFEFIDAGQLHDSAVGLIEPVS